MTDLGQQPSHDPVAALVDHQLDDRAPALRRDDYPFSSLVGEANVLIFPSLEAANVAYKLLQQLGRAVVIGPILMGMDRSVHVLSRGAEVTDILNVAAIAVVDAQNVARRRHAR